MVVDSQVLLRIVASRMSGLKSTEKEELLLMYARVSCDASS